MAAASNFIQTTVRIAFFRDKPQNLPASNHAVLLAALAALLSTAFLDGSAPISNKLEIAIWQVLAYGIAVAVVLYFAKRIERWRQTIAAILGTSAVVRCVAYFPIAFMEAFAQDSQGFFWLALIAVPFGIWGLCISAFILREALETSNGKAFFLALAVNLAVSIVVLQFFGDFPDPVTEPIQ